MRTLEIANPFAAPVFHAETVSSTMDVSRELAARGLPHGTVIAADFQTAGRGRNGDGRRSWDMDRGNLAFTILLKFADVRAIPRALTLRAGLAVSRAIEDFIPALAGTTRVKWPNDVMVYPAGTTDAPAKKTAGILTEADGGNVRIGIGINVTQAEFPDHLRDKATSLSIASGHALSERARFELLEKILSRLRAGLEDEADTWRSPLEERLYKKDELVSFAQGQADSGALIQGRLSGIGPDGELLITPCGENTPRAFFSGELLVY